MSSCGGDKMRSTWCTHPPRRGAVPGFQPKTSRTLSENHTTRLNSRRIPQVTFHSAPPCNLPCPPLVTSSAASHYFPTRAARLFPASHLPCASSSSPPKRRSLLSEPPPSATATASPAAPTAAHPQTKVSSPHQKRAAECTEHNHALVLVLQASIHDPSNHHTQPTSVWRRHQHEQLRRGQNAQHLVHPSATSRCCSGISTRELSHPKRDSYH